MVIATVTGSSFGDDCAMPLAARSSNAFHGIASFVSLAPFAFSSNSSRDNANSLSRFSDLAVRMHQNAE
jgi:hypothetical protein